MVVQPESTSSGQEGPAKSGPHVIDGKHEPYRLYRIVSENDKVVERTAREVAEGSKMLSNQELWTQNFLATVKQVRRWCDSRAPDLRAALINIRSNKLLIYLIPTSDRYHLKLGDSMTTLEAELNGSAGIGYVETLQVPARSLERFADRRSLVIWMREGETMFNPAATPSSAS
jgi:hypothetical protein